jgi:gliding motility-associated-like protein
LHEGVNPKKDKLPLFQADIVAQDTYLCFMRIRRSAFFIVLFVQIISGMAQLRVPLRLEISVEQCEKGSALLFLDPPQVKDSVVIEWSGGQANQTYLRGLSAGNYFVRVYILRRDSARQKMDTTVYFTINKERCPLSIPKYFSPNADNYNDLLEIANIDKYPEFELFIYNKTGQRVHHQKDTYEPWDGKWLGMDLPDDSYYYLLFYDKKNKEQFVKGDLTILR